MGLLVPEDFPLRSLANDEERAVVEAFRDHLSDDWVVLPDVALVAKSRDHQIDVVLAHPREGVAVIEVKGHRVQLRDGRFVSDRGPLDVAATRSGAQQRLRAARSAPRDGAVARRPERGVRDRVPEHTSRRGDLPPDLKPEQFMTSTFVDDPADAIDRLMRLRWGGRNIGDRRSDGDRSGVAPGRRARVRRDGAGAPGPATDGRPVRPARAHARAARRQPARPRHRGSGQRQDTARCGVGEACALARGERVLLTCYNDPLGGMLVERVPPNDRLVVGSFWTVARTFDGMPPLDVPDGADGEWWDTVAVGHLHSHWPQDHRRASTP